MSINLPTNKQRILILGKTGTGKTCGAVWHLSKHDFTKEKWIVLNHKRDDLIDSIPNAQHVDLDFRPKHNDVGLFIYHPIPDLDDDNVTSLLWDIHRDGYCGVYIDEGYMINSRNPALLALLTQGRSKYIPMIILSQRPSWISRFCVSEADFFQIFYLSDKRDRQTVNAFIANMDLEKLMVSPVNTEPDLKKYHSLYFDVGNNKANILTPVPTSDNILSQFNIKSNMNKRSI